MSSRISLSPEHCTITADYNVLCLLCDSHIITGDSFTSVREDQNAATSLGGRMGWRIPLSIVIGHGEFLCSTNFVLLAILTLLLKGSWHFRQIVLTTLVVVWGLRLGLFLLMRILQWGEDRRFDKMRDNLAKLAVFWVLQALWVWTVSLPLTIVNASDRNPSVKAQDVIGWVMWFVGLIVEATADQQKLVFKNSPANRGKWCNMGVWKYSRHPNYFGEILLWWGIFVASTPVLNDAEWLVVLGPIFLTVLLLFVSGIPLLEASANKRFGSVEEYRIYRSTTSPLIPLPPAIYESLPAWFKVAFLFELPLYNQGIRHDGMLS